MDLAAIPHALWFFLPAYVANPMAVVFGGGTPIDFGRTLRDGERLFGDGKTWRGLVGGTLMGALLGLLLTLPFLAFAPTSSWSFGEAGTAFSASAVLAFGALLGRRERRSGRSEEHTSELQSRGHLVCRLLLEKKKRS